MGSVPEQEPSLRHDGAAAKSDKRKETLSGGNSLAESFSEDLQSEPSFRDPNLAKRIQLPEEEQNNPKLEREARKLQKAIPTWLPDHLISYRNGRLKVTIETACRLKSRDYKKLKKSLRRASQLPVDLDLRDNQDGRCPLRRKARPPQQKSRQRRARIRREIERTIPNDVALIKTAFSPSMEGKGLDLVIVRVQRLEQHRKKLEAWRDRLEKKYGIGIHLQADTLKSDIRTQLGKYADSDGVIRDYSKLPSFAEFIHGRKRPQLTKVDQAPLPELEVSDLTSLPFVAIDNPGTRDPEDIIYHQELPDGNTLLMVGVVMFRRVAPGNQSAEWAIEAGESIYGRRVSVPLFPEEYAHDEAAFLEGEDRYGLLMTVELDPKGRIVKDELSIAKLRNHRQLTYQEVDQILAGEQEDEMSTELESLSHLASKLQISPIKGKGFVGRANHSGSDQIVAQCSIMSKHIFARAFEEHNETAEEPISILYRVHIGPDDAVKQRLLTEINTAGVKVGMEIFDEPVLFRRTLDELWNIGERALGREMLDVYYKRGHYSDENDGHSALQLGAYAPLKVRKAGWINQIQARMLLLGERGFSAEQIAQLEEEANRQQRRNDYKAYKLRLLEDIREQEHRLGERCSGKVKKVRRHDNSLYVQVPGHRRWGIVSLEGTGIDAKRFQVGDKLQLNFEGYDSRKLRSSFTFEGKEKDGKRRGRARKRIAQRG